jgi:hypothetical protein
MCCLEKLLKEQFADEGVVAVAFGSYKGSVVAARSWSDSVRKIRIPNAVKDFWKTNWFSIQFRKKAESLEQTNRRITYIAQFFSIGIYK